MGSLITPHCSNCKYPFKQMKVGGGMRNLLESVKVPCSCYDCGTIGVRNIYLTSNKCSKCKKDVVMLGKVVENVDLNEYIDSVFDWRFGSFEGDVYVLMNENYNCPKCKEMSLKFDVTGMWD